MRTIIAVCILMAGSGCFQSPYLKYDGTKPAIDAKAGFRDLRFGDPLPRSGFEEVYRNEDGTEITYKRAIDSLRIGGAEVDAIRYIFYRGRLYGVNITAPGYKNSRALLLALQETYGLGERPNRYIEKYRWAGWNVMLVYEHDEVKERGMAFMWDRAIVNEQQAYEKAAAQNSNL